MLNNRATEVELETLFRMPTEPFEETAQKTALQTEPIVTESSGPDQPVSLESAESQITSFLDIDKTFARDDALSLLYCSDVLIVLAVGPGRFVALAVLLECVERDLVQPNDRLCTLHSLRSRMKERSAEKQWHLVGVLEEDKLTVGLGLKEVDDGADDALAVGQVDVHLDGQVVRLEPLGAQDDVPRVVPRIHPGQVPLRVVALGSERTSER